ncbi:MAG: lipoprotein [Methylophilaceae bacterium]|nr:lipoprotein [Methylophilaceae bacterium]
MRLLSLCLLICLTLAACGIKGPLYIPEQQYPQDVPAPVPTLAPTPATK